MAVRSVRILLVDDSPFARRALERMLSQAPGIEVVGRAENGVEALELSEALTPDVMVLDLDMPTLDGLGVLGALQRHPAPPAVVVVSGAARSDAELTILALERGAFDFVDKTAVSSMEFHALAEEITSKVLAAASFRSRRGDFPAGPPGADPSTPEIVVMGASTGGPQALFRILEALPPDFPAPIAVVQHIPPNFLPPLVERIADRTSLAVREAAPGEAIVAGEVVFAGGRMNLEVVRRGQSLCLLQRQAPPNTPHVPSADALFHSAAQTAGSRAWGVLLTGMGKDGADGLLEIRRRGGLTIAQDEATCAVFGMPRAAVQLGAAAEVLPLPLIGPYLARAAVARAEPGPSGPIPKEQP
jgi:two-component system chemotaxis response regulator CheB